MEPSTADELNHRILVIDDNRAIHDDIRKILVGDAGRYPELASDEELLFDEKPQPDACFELASAYQGQEGLAMVEQALAEGRPFAMAFVDVRMPPGWDGVETIERLWRVCPNLQVVVCTAYSDYSWSDIRRRLGQSDNLLILKKPFDNIEVNQLAYALTKKWQVSRQAAARMEDLDRMVACRTSEVRKAEAAFRAVFEASPISITLHDMDGRCLEANQACARLLGLAKNAIIGRDPVELGWIKSHEAWNELGRQLASFGCLDARELSYAGPESGLRTGLLWMRAVSINHLPHVLAFFLDITDRKQMEQDLQSARLGAEAAARAKSEFLANMSHEIRTPLNGVLGLTSLFSERELPGDSHFLLRLIRTSGQTLAKILDDVLDFSKIECGKLELEQVPFSVRESLEWGVELFRAQADEKHLTLTVRVDDTVPQSLVGDATRIRQVLTNLLSNAIKFTEEGGIQIHAGCAPEGAPAGKQRIRIRVRDTGIGIPADKLDRLFRPFSQVDASTNRRFGGTGLGLVICGRLLAMMGGNIRVTSRPGEGSEFDFDFLAGVPASDEPLPVPAADSDLSRMRILVAEDNYVNQIVTERMLKKLGCTAELVPDGGAAVRRVQQAQFDLVLLDLHMPVMDGLEAARRIRSGFVSGKHLPLVALTASVTLEDREACRQAGMDDYLSKPLSLEALRKVLKRWESAQESPVDPRSVSPQH